MVYDQTMGYMGKTARDFEEIFYEFKAFRFYFVDIKEPTQKSKPIELQKGTKRMNFIVCKLFINEPDFKKKERKREG